MNSRATINAIPTLERIAEYLGFKPDRSLIGSVENCMSLSVS